jgi:hypothetical protein
MLPWRRRQPSRSNEVRPPPAFVVGKFSDHLPLYLLTARRVRRSQVAARRLADEMPGSSSVPVEVAEQQRATKSKTSDLTAMRHFEFRDEFSGVVARRFVALTICREEFRGMNEL